MFRGNLLYIAHLREYGGKIQRNMEEGSTVHHSVQGGYEKSWLKSFRGIWRKDLGEYGRRT